MPIEEETPLVEEPQAGEPTETTPQPQAGNTTAPEPQAGEGQQQETISLEEAKKSCARKWRHGREHQHMKTFLLTCALCGISYAVPFPTSANEGLCPACFQADRNRELDRLISAKQQCLKAQLEATLTLAHWLATLVYHGGRCAYCRAVPFSLIDLFESAHGLVAGNAVPCCKACSVHKAHGWQEAIDRVHMQLSLSSRLMPSTVLDVDTD